MKGFYLKHLYTKAKAVGLIIVYINVVMFYSNLFGQRVSESEKGMVVSSTTEATQAGLHILKIGGNAIDAAAATAFALMVTDPAMCSLGGRSQILLYFANGEMVGIDGATQSPTNVGEPARTGHGYKTTAIPGSPAALEKMLNQYGTLPLKTILKPAIKLARDGFKINEEYDVAFKNYSKYFRAYPGSAKYFLKDDGSFYSKGEFLKQPALAKTLEKIADNGCGILYRGELAKYIVDDMTCHQGLITGNDLAQYKTLNGEIVKGKYKEYDIIARGDQCDGGSVIEMLQILEQFDLCAYFKNEAQYIHLLAQVINRGYMDEMLPDEIQINSETARSKAREIDFELTRNKSGAKIEIYDEGETNHLCVVDGTGNAVSITQSIGPNFGSKVANPDLGFFYAYSYDMNDEPVPLQREKTSQSPTIILKDKRPVVVIGSAGSSRIPGSIVQSIINFVEHKMPPKQAVAYPRVFYFADKLYLEASQISDSTKIKLEKMGYNVKTYDNLNGWFGRVQAIFLNYVNETKIIGISDPRDFGAAMGL